ncbi:MAG: hypothetical protein FRX48_06284 [Lasallia pustulata]|uniref:Uncharacterized protein n=1 Tax=Lasallia pustulata TaxID=136370 RepID=A0A5M8PL97_9LECA|nr:MAG: hypothetical protein FRX48_06284 [Lasallia pustulata]
MEVASRVKAATAAVMAELGLGRLATLVEDTVTCPEIVLKVKSATTVARSGILAVTAHPNHRRSVSATNASNRATSRLRALLRCRRSDDIRWSTTELDLDHLLDGSSCRENKTAYPVGTFRKEQHWPGSSLLVV